MLRRAVALFLLLGPVQGPAAALFAGGSEQGGCTDHVCACVRSCPMRRPDAEAAGGCHGDAPSGPLLQPMGCGHGNEGAAPGGTRPHQVPPPAGLTVPVAATRLARCGDGAARPGFLKIDLPPPRVLARFR